MSEENLYTFENPEYRKTYWHTCSHVIFLRLQRSRSPKRNISRQQAFPLAAGIS